jgi:hypothetical protein
MHGKIHLRHALPLAVAGIAIAVTFGYGVASSGAETSSKPALTRMHVVEREVQHRNVDQGKRGISQGDKIVITSDILSTSGKVIGRADFDCTATGTGRLVGGICYGVVTLPGGQLTGQFGFGASGESEKQAITGGSGTYEGARGQFILHEGKGSQELVTIELVN